LILIGSISVRVRRDANEQMVLAHVTNRLSPLVSQLTVQVCVYLSLVFLLQHDTMYTYSILILLVV